MSADITTSISAGDASFVEFIRAAVEHPFVITSLIIILSLIALIGFLVWKPHQTIELLKVFHFWKRKKTKDIVKSDLLNHQIFKDIQFFLDYKLDQLYSSDSFSHFDKAKLAIGHDLLVIKLNSAKDWITSFVTDTNFDDPYLNVRSLLKHKFEKHQAFVWMEYKKIGIPQDFIEKFIEVCKIHTNYLMLSLGDLLSDKVPMTVYEKIYLVLGFLNQYYATLVVDMKDVIQSINGDLKGQIYKDMVIGGNDYRCYPVPNREYIPLVEKKLQELCLLTHANRSSVYIIHDFVGDDYLQGYFSKIYEYEATGYKPLMLKFQYKSASCLSDCITEYKQHEGIFIKVNKLNEVLRNLLQNEGILAVAAYPIFSHGFLRGFLAAEYTSIDVFDKVNQDVVMDGLKKYASILNIYTDYTKTGLNYTGNSVKEQS